MTTPKHCSVLSFIFTCLCISKPLLVITITVFIRNVFCFVFSAKPAKRQPTAQPVPLAQPVVAPVAQNGT